jgi:DNA-binding response OmpR family regulator
MNTTLLIADGQKEILNTLRLHLEKDAYTVLEAQNGSDALELVYLRRIDLVLLDISLPGMNGHYLVRKFRELAHVPIIVLSASDDTNELRTAYRLGADDYITKPLNLSDVSARIHGHLRKARQFSDVLKTDTGIFRYEDIELDTDNCEIKKGGLPLDLTPTEYKLLRHFIENPGRVFNNPQLYEVGWNDTRFVDDTTIGDCISEIRTKLGDTEGTYICTVPEAGYSLGPAS